MQIRNTFLALALFSVCMGCSHVQKTALRESDEPEMQKHNRPIKDADTFEGAMKIWRTPEDINEWIGGRFQYNMSRALQLSETQKQANGALSIHTPEELFLKKSGICIDLSRFAYESLKRIAPETDPKYLMIKFDPVQIRGNTLRLHWIISFKRADKYYFFADSKRPGYIAGPYNNVDSFIAEYTKYRDRNIIEFKELDSYQKKKAKATRS